MPKKRASATVVATAARVPSSGGRARASRQPSGQRRATAQQDLRRANQELSQELRGLRDRQRNLEEARTHYVDLFDFAPVTYALLDPVGMVIQINLAGCRLLNVERQQLIGRPLLAFVTQEDRREFLGHLRRCRSSKGVVETELRFARPDTEVVICRLYSKHTVSGERHTFPTVIVDQTERLALDAARLSAERGRDDAARDAQIANAASAAKDRFLATVSHELRTPLTPALLAASRLASWDDLPKHARTLADTIKRNIQLEARLIDDLLDLARINRDRISLTLESLDVDDVVREAIRICQPTAEEKTITITAHFLASAHHVTGDRTRLGQVFSNLLNNAIKFTDAGGSIVVHTTPARDGVVRVTIRDSGAGMDAAVLERLFAPFDRRPEQVESRAGLGLGLAICKGIIAAHGGQVWASSEGPGLGSTFGVELTTIPRPAEAASPQDFTPAPASVTNAPEVRVLLIEDDADSREMLSLFLSHYGYRVEAVSSLREGIGRLDEPWDVVLSDIGLPDGSGLEVARNARRKDHRPGRLIALTGYGACEDIEASRDAGFDDHVVKPIDLDRLLDSLHRPRGQGA